MSYSNIRSEGGKKTPVKPNLKKAAVTIIGCLIIVFVFVSLFKTTDDTKAGVGRVNPSKLREEVMGNMVAIPGKNFMLGKTEVTFGLWESVTDFRPYEKEGQRLRDDLIVKYSVYPVSEVNYSDCEFFIRRLNEMTGLQFRLPTEDEWEYACRAGSTGKFGNLKGGCEGTIDEMGWYEYNAIAKTQPVAQLKPNAWGLYDMHGNVCEWCVKCHESIGHDGIARGGHYLEKSNHCTSDYRRTIPSDMRSTTIGFRLALTIDPSVSK